MFIILGFYISAIHLNYQGYQYIIMPGCRRQCKPRACTLNVDETVQCDCCKEAFEAHIKTLTDINNQQDKFIHTLVDPLLIANMNILAQQQNLSVILQAAITQALHVHSNETS
jgi:hypothetical protein